MSALIDALVAGVLLSTAVLLSLPAGDPRARLAAIRPPVPESIQVRAKRAADLQLRGRIAGAGAALAAAALVGGLLGVVVGLVAAVLVPRLLAGLEPAAVREQRRQVLADLPVATDLLAACLASGASPPAALATVGRAVGGALGSRLERLSSVLLLGADPAAAWRSLASHPELGRVARAVVRSLDTGAPVAPALERAARDLRARRRSTAEAAARAVAVKAVAPLGLCFLPAFLLVGIVPTVWGMAARTFAGLV